MRTHESPNLISRSFAIMISKARSLVLFTAIMFFGTVSHAATYVVDRTDDVAGASACTAAANDCSLRGALNNANANGSGADIINFNVGGGNAQTITISSTALPTIQTSLTIDGTTQPLWGGLPLIEINGAATTGSASGFQIQSPIGNTAITVTIKGLVINRFDGSGIYFNASSGITATVTGCYIGTNPGGSIDQGNGDDGIRISGFSDSTFNIGGNSVSERNVISGNDDNGIQVTSALGFDIADTQVTLLNNFIGTSSAGNADLGNSENGVSFGGPGFGYSFQVGSGLANGRNIISGNDSIGIAATSGTITIVGNYIGTSFNGNADIGNTLDGIQIAGDVPAATIGGTVLGIPVGNVISGNDRMGIWINDASIPTTIRGNKIGTNAAGNADLGNSSDGIFLWENDTFTDSSIVIGSDTLAQDGNTISGNDFDGIEISEKVRQVKIYGNKVGTNEAGTATIGNSIVGIRIQSSQNEIGLAGNNIASNVVAGNNDGIFFVGSSANGNKLYNNFIGTNTSGTNLGNVQSGIYINQNALGNQIGNAAAGGENKIAFNGSNGINVAQGSLNIIRGNSIHSNVELGIDLDGNGVTANDNGDPDTGGNARQNFPVIQRATPTRITGFLNSLSDSQFSIDFYRVDSCDPSGYGEGRYYLGSQNVQTSAISNIAGISFPTTLSVGQFVTATATYLNAGVGDTSEFSQCVAVTGEPGNLSLSASTYSVNESSASRTIVVSRSGGSTGTIQATYETTNGTATAADYTSQTGIFTFNNGETVKTFDIPINNDTLDETDETVNITLGDPSPGVFLTPNASAVMTIIDNDAPPVISIEDVTHEEGNLNIGQFSFRVSLSTASGLPVSVDYTTTPGTATASSDYVTAGGTVNFAPGETLKNIVVIVFGDLTPELNETFTVDLSNPGNATFGDNQALGTIVDDDNPGKFSFAFAPYSGTEHDSVMVTVSRTNGDAGTVSVDYMTNGGSATPVADYTPVSGTLIFSDGETAKTFFVTLSDDANPEPTESVNLVLSNPIGGATLGVPSIAVLNIFDNDSGTLLNLGGEVRLADNTPVANVTVTLQGGASATTTTDPSGRYTFPNLAPNGNYTVTPSALGYTFTPITRQYNNLANDVLNANFTATPAPSRQLRVIGGNATPGQNISVNVELVAQGDENAAGFSLNYDNALLTNPQAALGADASNGFLTVNTSQSGKIGIIVALQSGQNFTAGTKQIVTITFNTLPTPAYSSPVTFGDIPIVKQVVNTNADPLPTIYIDGAVTFAQGFEADVAPRPTGNNNGTITVADFTQVGRFVAGLDTVDPAFNEYQRVDCAPRPTSGNGQLTVSDYTQAGRYAAMLDAVSPTGGPNSASFAPIADSKEDLRSLAVPTVVRVVNTQTSPGQQVLVSIEADAQGTENGFGFTIGYDTTKLSNPLVTKGTDTQSATLIPNIGTAGRVGVVLGLPFGVGLPAGTRQLVTIRFDVANSIFGGTTPLVVGDTPVFREVSDVNAGVLDSNFLDGEITILGPSSANVTVSGSVLTETSTPIPGANVTIEDQAGNRRLARTNGFGHFRITDIEAGRTYTLSTTHKRYQFTTQLLTVSDDVADLIIVGQALP